MCWSGEASTVLASIGMATTAWAAYRREPASMWATLGYFSLMEALQAYTYSVVDNCALPANQIATLLGYLHIAFQPFFASALSLHFIPAAIARRVAGPVYALCGVSALIMLVQLYPFDWAPSCAPGKIICGRPLCSVSADFHLAWLVPYNGILDFGIVLPFFDSDLWSYSAMMFVMPLLYGSWRLTLYHFIVGPVLARLITADMNEFPAIWCLLSIGLLLIVVKSPLRRLLYVRDYPLWPRRLLTAA